VSPRYAVVAVLALLGLAAYAQITSIPSAAGGSPGGYSNLTQNADGSLNAAKASTVPAPTATAAACDWSLSNACTVTAAGGNVTVTFSNPHGSGPYTLGLCNDASARTWTLPVTALNAVKPAIASTCTYQFFQYDGSTNYQGLGSTSTETPSILRGTERVAPIAPVAGTFALYDDSTTHLPTFFIGGSSTPYTPVANIVSPSTVGGGGKPLVILSNTSPAADTLSCATITTTETTFATNYTLPANFFDVGTILRVSASFDVIGTAGPTFTPRLRFGSTAGSVTGVNTYTSIPGTANGTSPNSAGFIVDFMGTAAPGASVAAKTQFRGAAAPFGRSSTAFSNLLATNGTLLIQATLTCSAATAGNSFQLLNLMIEGN
jgi:hypothetical protein